MSNLSQFFSGGAKPWVSGSTYKAGDVVTSPADNYQMYVRVIDGAGTTDPSSDSTNWKPHGGRTRKSIQRGVAQGFVTSTTLNITISSVDMAKSRVTLLGFRNDGKTIGSVQALADIFPTLSLTTSTNLQAVIGASSSGNIRISWEVEESY